MAPNKRRKPSRTGTWHWTSLPTRKARSKATRKPPAPAQPPAEPVPPVAAGNRPLTVPEQRAGIDFDTLTRTLDDGIAGLITAWRDVRAEQMAELARQIVRAGADPAKAAAIQAPVLGADLLLGGLQPVAEAGVAAALAESANQGILLAPPPAAEVQALLEARSRAAAELLARALSEAAARKAVTLTSPVVPSARVADAVVTHLDSLTDRWLRDQLNGLLMGGMNTGRISTLALAEAPSRFYISALMDQNTCSVCAQFDGRQYDTLEEMELQLPTGGNRDCLGGVRCRCTGVAVFEESPASVQ